jgi:hypothetical protein
MCKIKDEYILSFARSNKNINTDFKHIFLWQMGEWKTVRLIAPIVTAKLSEKVTVELKGRKSENSEVFFQRIAGCNGEGMHFVVNRWEIFETFQTCEI